MMRLADAHSYRVGRTLGCTLYAQLTPEPRKIDAFLALFNTRDLASVAAARLNGHPQVRPLWVAIGRLIYEISERIETDEFIAVAVTADVAASIVAAVNEGWPG